MVMRSSDVVCIPVLDSGRFPRSVFFPQDGWAQGRAVCLNASLHELVEPYRPTEVGHGSDLTGNCLFGRTSRHPIGSGN